MNMHRRVHATTASFDPNWGTAISNILCVDHVPSRSWEDYSIMSAKEEAPGILGVCPRAVSWRGRSTYSQSGHFHYIRIVSFTSAGDLLTHYPKGAD